MKKLLLFALAAVMMAGCIGDYKPKSIPLLGYDLAIIDSCEYIYSSNTMAHKGNCKFCKERRQKELMEIVELLKDK